MKRAIIAVGFLAGVVLTPPPNGSIFAAGPLGKKTGFASAPRQEQVDEKQLRKVLMGDIETVLEGAFPFTLGPPGKRITFSRPDVLFVSDDRLEVRVRVRYKKTRGIPQYTTRGKGRIKANLVWPQPNTACVTDVRFANVDLRRIPNFLDKHIFKGHLNKQLRTICLDSKGKMCFDPEKPPKGQQGPFGAIGGQGQRPAPTDPLAAIKADAYQHPEKYRRPAFCVHTALAMTESRSRSASRRLAASTARQPTWQRWTGPTTGPEKSESEDSDTSDVDDLDTEVESVERNQTGGAIRARPGSQSSSRASVLLKRLKERMAKARLELTRTRKTLDGFKGKPSGTRDRAALVRGDVRRAVHYGDICCRRHLRALSAHGKALAIDTQRLQTHYQHTRHQEGLRVAGQLEAGVGLFNAGVEEFARAQQADGARQALAKVNKAIRWIMGNIARAGKCCN